MGFGDLFIAAEVRDAITKIAEEAIKRLRPETIIGEVYDFNYGQRTALIQPRGHTEDELLQVRFSEGNVPVNSILAPLEGEADIVRVGGSAGSYYIVDFIRGFPRNMRYEGAMNPVGTILSYGGDLDDTMPYGYGACLGQFELIEEYPTLFARIKHNFNKGTDDLPIDPGDGTFRFPDGRYRYLIGAYDSGTHPELFVGSNDGDDSLDLRWDRLNHSHTHAITAQEATGESLTAGSGTAVTNIARFGQFQGHSHGGVTGSRSALIRGTSHAWLAVNYIIKV